MSLPRALRFRQRWQLCRTAQPWGGAGPPVQHQPVMVAGGSLAPVGLLWLCLAPAALLRLRQPQPILVVESGEPVEIGCEASEDMESKGNVLWYRRGGTDGLEQVLHCWSGTKGRFSCEYKRHKVTLRIAKASPEDAGIYLCAYNNGYRLDFGSGTALLVGDIWGAESWVRALAPRGDPWDPPSLVCAMGGTAGPVLVSWPGGIRRVLGLGASVELFNSSVGLAGRAGGLCEVRVNASRSPVRWGMELREAAGCPFRLSSTLGVAGVGVLLLLSLCLSICHLRRLRRLRHPTPVGKERGTGGGHPTVSPLSPAVLPISL
ncbi:T-cell surface glycoprotein CD8 beta chain-like isoform 2-T2 [Theristicus caerulescens]